MNCFYLNTFYSILTFLYFYTITNFYSHSHHHYYDYFCYYCFCYCHYHFFISNAFNAFLKPQVFFFFSEALPMCNQIINIITLLLLFILFLILGFSYLHYVIFAFQCKMAFWMAFYLCIYRIFLNFKQITWPNIVQRLYTETVPLNTICLTYSSDDLVKWHYYILPFTIIYFILQVFFNLDLLCCWVICIFVCNLITHWQSFWKEQKYLWF